MYTVVINGFRTKKQAQAFLDWYEGGGEQSFDDHLDIVGLPWEDGCNIDVHKAYRYEGNSIIAEVESSTR